MKGRMEQGRKGGAWRAGQTDALLAFIVRFAFAWKLGRACIGIRYCTLVLLYTA